MVKATFQTGEKIDYSANGAGTFGLPFGKKKSLFCIFSINPE